MAIWKNRFVRGRAVLRSVSIVVAVSASSTASIAADGGFKDRLATVLEAHNLARAAELGAQSASERIQETRGVLFPTLNVTSSIGKEDQINSSASNTALTPRDFNVTLTQRLYDFGASDASIARSEAQSRAQGSLVAITSQNLLLQGIVAQIEVIRSLDLLRFAKKTEIAVAEQEARERAREEGQAGSATDLLQVRAQLGGAKQASLLAAQRHDAALNTYKRIFGTNAQVSGILEEPVAPIEFLPGTLDEAIEMARGRNLQVAAARGQSDILKKTAEEIEKTAYSPSINAVAEFKAKKDFGGTVGYEREALAKVELSFPFNLGFTAKNSISAADLDYQSSVLRADNLADQIEEQVRNAWQQYVTARSRYQLGLERVDFGRDFVDFAIQERDNADGSVANVLLAETLLNTSESDTSSARRDITVAAFTLLSLVSGLSLDTVATEPFDASAVSLGTDINSLAVVTDGLNTSQSAAIPGPLGSESSQTTDPTSVPVPMLAQTLPFITAGEATSPEASGADAMAETIPQVGSDVMNFWDPVHGSESSLLKTD